MMDVDIFGQMTKLLNDADHARSSRRANGDEFGQYHLILFGDFKQLPPATSPPHSCDRICCVGM